MSTHRLACSRASGVKLKHEEVLTPVFQQAVSSCMSACTFVLMLCMVIYSVSPSAHLVFMC